MCVYANRNSYRGFFHLLLLSPDLKTVYNTEGTLEYKQGASQKHGGDKSMLAPRRHAHMLTGGGGGHGALMLEPGWAESFFPFDLPSHFQGQQCYIHLFFLLFDFNLSKFPFIAHR